MDFPAFRGQRRRRTSGTPLMPVMAAGVPRCARRHAWPAALLALAITFGAAAQGSAQVDVTLDGEAYVVRASAPVAADPRVVWETLTDYEGLREFVPGVTRTRTLTRADNQIVIEQVGVFSVFFFDLPVHIRLAVQHTPYTSVLARLTPGPVDAAEPTLRSFSGRYTLTPIRLQERAGVRLDYDARFELARPLPPMIGSLFGIGAIRRTMREQFVAMLREIERRQAAVSTTERGP